jgi:hypothetical protein
MLSQILLLIFSILMLALTITNAIFFNMVRSATAKATGTSLAGMSNGQATTMVILNLIGAALALIGTIYFIYRLVKIV